MAASTIKKLTAQERLKIRCENGLRRKAGLGPNDTLEDVRSRKLTPEQLRALLDLECFRREWKERMAREGIL